VKVALVGQPLGTISLLDQNGSIEIWIYEVARRLAQSCDVIVYAKKGLFQKKVECDQDVQYRRISTVVDEWFTGISAALDKLGRFPTFRNMKRTLFFRNAKRPLFASSLYYLTYILQVAKQLRVEKCDIVHLHNFSQFVPIIRAFNPKIKIVLHMHCEWLTQLDRTMIERRLRKTDLIIGCSEYITEKIRCSFPKFAERCQVLYNGVDVNQFVSKNGKHAKKKNSAKQLLYVGRISPEKGLHVLLDAFKKVVSHYPQTQLTIVGPQGSAPIEFIVALSDNPRVSDLASFYRENYISHLQKKLPSFVAGQVFFTGFVTRRQLINHYQNADVFIFPSVWDEPFGMPPVESMATGVPVVATRVGGIKEIVEEEKTGILVEPSDASALSEAILHLFSHENLRKKMGKTARRRAANSFSWEQIAKSLLRQYKNIC